MLSSFFKKNYMKQLFIYLFLFSVSYIASAQDIEQFGKFETDVNVTATYQNAYDYDEVAVTAIFTGPDGTATEVDGFYIENFLLNTNNGSLSPAETGFKVRFSPDQVGSWTYEISITDASGTIALSSDAFQCVASTAPNNHGFVRKNETNYLNFDDGEQYILIGENMAWQTGNTLVNYKSWVSGLSDFGGNFIRLWHAHWGLGIEWKDGWNGFGGLRKYQQVKSRYQDWLYDYCAENGVYVMLCIQHHGQVSTNVNPNWNDSPYNVANGGPCQNTWDFFTNEQAIADTKNRLRYIVARWGYARSIMAWELFNEVEWTDNFNTHRSVIADWHFEMTDYLKSIDPYGHLLTTSYAEESEDPEVWSYPEIDITQTHFYNNVPNLEKVLVGGVRKYLEDFDKPTLTGEFGLGGSADLANADPDGIHLHNSLWGALFGGGMGTGMTWWWDNYIHPQNLYFHFDGVNKLSQLVPFLEKDLSPASVFVSGASGALLYVPGGGWGIAEDNFLSIDAAGQITPANVTLGQYLYGSQWNTELRNPPTFQVDYGQNGYFEVVTGSETGQAPNLTIMIDDVMVLNTAASTSTTYRVDVPAGMHTIKVDNTGTDWLSIASYNFSNLGSQVDNYVLTSADQTYATGWVLNKEYNHRSVIDNGNPAPAVGAALTIPDFEAGNYMITWLDCLTGEVLSAEPLVVGDDGASISVPDLFWDAAFVLDVEAVTSVADLERTSFKMYPNPVAVGEQINLSGLETETSTVISIVDMAGRTVHTYPVTSQVFGRNNVELLLPGDLSTGMYWLKVQQASGHIMAEPLMVGKR